MTSRLTTIMITSCLCVVAQSTFAADVRHSKTEDRTAVEESKVVPSDTIRVKGKGCGVTKEDALKDAYRDAVERAVGVYVDPEQLVDNDKVVVNKILTHSNAYIERFDEIGQKDDKGLLRIEIVAWVRKGDLTRKLREVMPAATVNVSQVNRNLYAEIVTKDRRDGNAEALLKDMLDDFDPLAQLMKVVVANPRPEISQSKSGEDAKIFSYQLKFEIDADKYFKIWAPRMDKILSQISLTPGQPFNFRRELRLSGIWNEKASKAYETEERTSYFSYDNMFFMTAKLFGEERFIWGEECDLNRDHVYDGVKLAMSCNGGPYSDSWYEVNRLIRRWGTVPEMKTKSKLYVAIVNRVSRSGCSGTFYELSQRSASVISSWMKRYSGLSDERKTWTSGSENARKTCFHISLKDADGDELAGGDCMAFNHDMSNLGCVCWGEDKLSYHRDKPGKTIPYVIYITPWVGCFAGECSTWVDVDVATEDIAKIATISISTDKR